jgi:hypothetical protein
VGEPTTLAAHTTIVPQPRSLEERLQQKSFAQVVNDARYTLFTIAQNTKPPAIMPTGRRSVLDSLIKAKQDTSRPVPPGTIPPGTAPHVASQRNNASASDGANGATRTAYIPPPGNPGVSSVAPAEAQPRTTDAGPSDKQGGLTGILIKTWKQLHPDM